MSGRVTGPVEHPADRGQSDRGAGELRGPFDRLQHTPLRAVKDGGGLSDQFAGLLRGEFGDGLAQCLQSLSGGVFVLRRAVQPPFSRSAAGAAGVGLFGRDRPIFAVHNASLIST